MGLCFGRSRSSPPPQPPPPPPLTGWSDLSTDLAGLIFSSLPSHHDRLSFRAVCSQWRLGALRQNPLPPALPWLLTLMRPPAYESLADGVVRLIPDANSALWCLSAYDDGWLMDVDMGMHCVCISCNDHIRYFLKNSFSKATMDIPCRFDQPINTLSNNRYSTWPKGLTLPKIIVCSPDLVVAGALPNKIVSFRPGIDPSWPVFPCDDDGDDDDHKRIYEDIALYRGKLYSLTSKEDLVHEIRNNSTLSRAEHAIRAAEPPLSHFEVQYNFDYILRQYLVISCSGKPLMFRCTISSMVGISADVNNNAIKFKAFEADLEGCQWLEVKSLDDQVIFLSKACSKAIRSFDHGGPRFGRNCILFLGADLTTRWGDIHTRITNRYVYQQKEGIPLYGVYDFRTSKISLISLGGEHRYPSMVQWFFPCM